MLRLSEFRELNDRARRRMRQLVAGTEKHERDVLAMHALAPLSTRFVPWSVMAMRPSAMLAIVNDIVLHERKAIVECGSGLSTIYIARLLRENGGTLISVEHDSEWADVVSRLLQREELDAFVDLIIAPLGMPDPSTTTAWYDVARLQPLLERGPFDMLIVDGPPAHLPATAKARYPALPFFAGQLANDCTVVLDDVRRSGEQEVLAQWEHEFGMHFDRRPVDGGIALARHRRFVG